MNNYCYKPFSEIEIYSSGEVYTCCPSYLPENYYIGNIFEVKTFDEIWYSDKAINLRKNILEKDFSICNLKICDKEYKPEIEYVERPPYPKYLRFSYDTKCNLYCAYCRDSINNQTDDEFWDKKIDEIFIPLIEKAELITISTTGELTISKHSQQLIKKAVEVNNNVKFDLLTNGLLFTEDFYNKLDLKKRIKRIQITVSAAKKQTYEKLLRGSDFKKVKENIKFIGELRKNNEIDEFYLAFVTSKINYKELPEFIELCIKNNAIALIWELRTVPNTKLCQDIENQAVWKETHPNYNDFVRTIKLIKNKYSENSYILHDIFSKLEPISIIDELKTKLRIS